MKLATFTEGGKTRIGLVDGDAIVDLAAAAPALPHDMIEFLKAGEPALEAARAAMSGGPRIALGAVELRAPVLRPGKIMAIGLNYADHVAETGQQPPKYQMWFSKAVTSIAGPYDDVQKPLVSDALDYEAELCIVIGRRCKHVSPADAPKVIAGYCCGNDVSVRDWQRRTPQWVIGKSFDTHAPIGPWITTGDEVGDPHALAIRSVVNGEVRQNSNTRHLIFNCFDQVSELSSTMTLEPGDVIFTGTSGGVGVAMNPPKFMKAGDTVRIEIDKLGAIENRIVIEKDGSFID